MAESSTSGGAAAPEKKQASSPAPAPTGDRQGQPPPPQPAAKAPKKGSKAAKYIQDKVHVWPHLTRLEMMSAIAATVLLTVWAIAIDAPLESPANPARTPNPSKAPWYFLGLQEMLVYFDPWIAGVLFPTMIIVGLMVIPYIDPNPRGNGYYTFRERWFAISTFLFGFLILWISLIVLGTFFRGPGWNLFWPWQAWDPHKVVPLNNVDVNEFIALLPAKIGFDVQSAFYLRWKAIFLNKVVALFVGVGLIGGFFATGLRFFGHFVAIQQRFWDNFWNNRSRMLTVLGASAVIGIGTSLIARAAGFASVGGPEAAMKMLILSVAIGGVVFVAGLAQVDTGFIQKIRTGAAEFKKLMGPMRYYTVGLLYVVMMGLVVKIFLRQLFNIKYIVQIPWINANI